MRHSRISVVARESLSGWAQSSHVRAAFAGTVDEFRGFLEERIHSTGAFYFVCDVTFGGHALEESLRTVLFTNNSPRRLNRNNAGGADHGN